MHARIRATASLAVARRVGVTERAMDTGDERSGFQDEHEIRSLVVLASRYNKRCTFAIRIAINIIRDAFLEGVLSCVFIDIRVCVCICIYFTCFRSRGQ